MNKIVGYEKEKKEMAELKKMLLNAEMYRECGVRIPRGILLCGIPGVGKTALAHSICGDGINLVELRAATCNDDEATVAIETVFSKAKESAPCVLLLDELDKIVGDSSAFYMEDNNRIRKLLLQELDGLKDTDTVLVVATCNDDECIGDALIRPGRFDRRIEIDVPDEKTRARILTSYFNKIKIKRTIDIPHLAKNTHGFTGAMLECLVNEAGIHALRKSIPVISENDIRIIINRMEFGATEKTPFVDEKTLHRIAVHEAGHALAAMLISPEKLYGATVLPQGNSNGHIRFVKNDISVYSVSEIENEAVVLLAGHVAERIILGEYLTGSSTDISNAAMRIHYLITKEAAYGYGFVLTGFMKHADAMISESVKERLTKQIDTKLTFLDAMAEKLIRDHMDAFFDIVESLEKKYVLTRDDLEKIKEKAAAESVAA